MNANFANIEENRKNKILSGILKLLSIPFKTEKNMLFTVLLCIVAYTVGVVLHNDIVMEYVDLFAKVIAIISFVGVYEFLFELRKRNAKEERILNMQARNLDMLVRVTKRIEGDSNKILKELSSHLKMDVRKDSKLVDLIVRIEKII